MDVQSKALRKSELPGSRSHQHEINVPNRAEHIFRCGHRWLPCDFHFASADGTMQTQSMVPSCFYDVRAGNKLRNPEFKLYYPYSLDSQMRELRPGDDCVFVRDLDRMPHVILAPRTNDPLFRSNADLSVRELVEALHLPKQYRTIDIQGKFSAGQEQEGKKRKQWFWLRNADGLAFLFKWQRDRTVEAAVEKISAELAALAGLPTPLTFLGRDGEGRLGSLSVSFTVPFIEDLGQFPSFHAATTRRKSHMDFATDNPQMGSQVLQGAYAGYQRDQKYKQVQYTLENIRTGLQSLKGAESIWPDLLRYLIFDAWIGNTDRHHDNWMVIGVMHGDNFSYSLAPTYDHGPALGGTMVNLERRRAFIDDHHQMRSFYRAGKSAIFGADGKIMKFPRRASRPCRPLMPM